LEDSVPDVFFVSGEASFFAAESPLVALSSLAIVFPGAEYRSRAHL
jgi:hypothetical protein